MHVNVLSVGGWVGATLCVKVYMWPMVSTKYKSSSVSWKEQRKGFAEYI